MNDSAFVKVFNVAEIGYHEWWFPAFGFIFIILGVCLLISAKRNVPPVMTRTKPWNAAFFLGFAILWTIGGFVSTYLDYDRSRNLLLTGHADHVEGIVRDFVEVPGKSESFTVQGVAFRYSDNIVTAGFNHMASYGGPIRPGLYVRIWYRRGNSDWTNEILRLDIRK